MSWEQTHYSKTILFITKQDGLGVQMAFWVALKTIEKFRTQFDGAINLKSVINANVACTCLYNIKLILAGGIWFFMVNIFIQIYPLCPSKFVETHLSKYTHCAPHCAQVQIMFQILGSNWLYNFSSCSVILSKLRKGGH